MVEYQRSELTFEQAEGLAPLPSQMALRTLSKPLRAFLLDKTISSIREEMYNSRMNWQLGPDWENAYKSYHMKKGIPSSSVDTTFTYVDHALTKLFMEESYAKVLGAIEDFIKDLQNTHLKVFYMKSVSEQLERFQCAYRLNEGFICPVSTPEEGQTIEAALDALSVSGMGGARSHILKAGSALTAGKFADSIRESIHAVESTARTLTGKGSLKDALEELARRHPMHRALKGGLNQIYGYTSDQNGIRHSLVGDDAPQVGEAEALFMFGACAAFVTFLSRIAQ